MRPRVILVDDQAMVLECLSVLLGGEFEVVGAFTDGATALAAARELQPDVVALELELPTLGGSSCCARCRRARRAARWSSLATPTRSGPTRPWRRGPAGTCSRTRRPRSWSPGCARSPRAAATSARRSRRC
ncbi:response regulator [Nannocystis pusilla]|uniref:Response regulator n=1 Tax=Nannocystis pusilla TaxID=889268 RepID=A0A9X3ENW2_9BACT|nr:response regulator [Nannocystis pusilla]MCY1007126.1 response regulator [Nannocystis pusilla]